MPSKETILNSLFCKSITHPVLIKNLKKKKGGKQSKVKRIHESSTITDNSLREYVKRKRGHIYINYTLLNEFWSSKQPWRDAFAHHSSRKLVRRRISFPKKIWNTATIIKFFSLSARNHQLRHLQGIDVEGLLKAWNYINCHTQSKV